MSLKDLVIYGMIFMVPIAPFSVFGFVWHDARGMVPLAYLLGLTGMFFTALSYASLSRAFPVAGSVYAYAQHGLHEVAGFFAGWLILLDYILTPALCYVFSSVALRPLMPAVPAAAWLVVFIVFNVSVNLIGIEFSARVNRGLLVLELAVLSVFLILGLIALYGGAGAGRLTLQPLYDPQAFSMKTVAGATSIAVLSFLGFDGISTLAEESKGGLRSVGRATMLALALIGILFVMQTWLATDLARGLPFGSLDTAFYDIANRAGGPWLRFIIIVAVVLASAIANAMAAMGAVARILFAMARDGKLPAVLGKVHPRFMTPYVSTLFVAGLSLLVGLMFVAHLDDLTTIVNFGALSSFVLLHLSVIRHFLLRQRSANWMRHLLCPFIGMIIIFYVLFEMDHMAKVVGAAWIALGAVYFLLMKWWFRRPAALDL